MATFVKFANIDINPDRLHDELLLAGIEPEGILFAGFHSISKQLMEPFTETEVIATHTGLPDTTADPGELHFRYPSDPGTPLDTLLSAHDATLLSRAQTNNKSDTDAVPILIDKYQNWGTLSDSEKFDVLRAIVRLVARHEDASQDV